MKRYFLKIFLTVVSSAFVVSTIVADPPGPPPPGGSPVGTGTPVGQEGSGAPIDDGIYILLALAAGYGAYKFYEAKKLKAKTTGHSTK